MLVSFLHMKLNTFLPKLLLISDFKEETKKEKIWKQKNLTLNLGSYEMFLIHFHILTESL